MVVLFFDDFILLMYKSLEKKEIVNKLHQSCLCPFKVQPLKSVSNSVVEMINSVAVIVLFPIFVCKSDIVLENFLSA